MYACACARLVVKLNSCCWAASFSQSYMQRGRCALSLLLGQYIVRTTPFILSLGTNRDEMALFMIALGIILDGKEVELPVTNFDLELMAEHMVVSSLPPSLPPSLPLPLPSPPLNLHTKIVFTTCSITSLYIYRLI